MALVTFLASLLAAYGPSLAIFFVYIAPNAQLVILMVSSAFFWLLSILLSSAIWYAASGAQTTYTATIAYTVLLQELFRWLLFKLVSRAESGLNTVATHPNSVYNQSQYSFAGGLGFGIMSGSISFVSLLSQSLGPGALMCVSCPNITVYFISAVTTGIMILHHCAWMMVAFTGFSRRSVPHTAWVVISHYGASYLTLLNSSTTVTFGCAYSILGNVALLMISIVYVLYDIRQIHAKSA